MYCKGLGHGEASLSLLVLFFLNEMTHNCPALFEKKKASRGNILLVLLLFLKESLTQVWYIFKEATLLFSSHYSIAISYCRSKTVAVMSGL
jgi:hypothetical protein